MLVKLYPSSKRDRRIFWSNLFFIINIVYYLFVASYFFVVFFSIILTINFILIYLFPDEIIKRDSNEYDSVITQIKNIEEQLSNFNKFLVKERKRVQDTEYTIKKLENEKNELEPIVLSHRETVQAILNAQAKYTSAYLWKERIFGFLIGILASFLATILYDYIKL
ncbi:MAG: hypothetical protein ABI638_13575 [Ignavibacteriota bacterium]